MKRNLTVGELKTLVLNYLVSCGFEECDFSVNIIFKEKY